MAVMAATDGKIRVNDSFSGEFMADALSKLEGLGFGDVRFETSFSAGDVRFDGLFELG